MKTLEGKIATTNKPFYGYKAHLSLNAQSGIITSVVVTRGNETDGKQLAKLVGRDQRVGVEGEVYAGDKGYDDGENHELLRAKGKKSGLCLNRCRAEKKDPHKGSWLRIKESEQYWEGLRERYKIEQEKASRVGAVSVSGAGFGEVCCPEFADGDGDEPEADSAVPAGDTVS